MKSQNFDVNGKFISLTLSCFIVMIEMYLYILEVVCVENKNTKIPDNDHRPRAWPYLWPNPVNLHQAHEGYHPRSVLTVGGRRVP